MNNKQAFTLIELLVVVLIIGILASVALPQYEKAVEKTRLNLAIHVMSNIQRGIDLYVLENGYTGATFLGHQSNFADNDDLPIDPGLNCVNGTSGTATVQRCTDSNGYRYVAHCYSSHCEIRAHLEKSDRNWHLYMTKRKDDGLWIKEYEDGIDSNLSRALLAGLESQGWRSCC